MPLFVVIILFNLQQSDKSLVCEWAIFTDMFVVSFISKLSQMYSRFLVVVQNCIFVS